MTPRHIFTDAERGHRKPLSPEGPGINYTVRVAPNTHKVLTALRRPKVRDALDDIAKNADRPTYESWPKSCPMGWACQSSERQLDDTFCHCTECDNLDRYVPYLFKELPTAMSAALDCEHATRTTMYIVKYGQLQFTTIRDKQPERGVWWTTDGEVHER